jgi:uncharacterized delta-60 repeat protein
MGLSRRDLIIIVFAVIVILVLLFLSKKSKVVIECADDADCGSAEVCIGGTCYASAASTPTPPTPCNPTCSLTPADLVYDTIAQGYYYGHVQSDNKVLTSVASPATLVTRWNVDGTIDTTFGTGGTSSFLTNSFLGGYILGVTSGSDHSVYGFGAFTTLAVWTIGSDWNAGVVKLNPDGTTDLSYGTNGFAILEVSIIDGLTSYRYPRSAMLNSLDEAFVLIDRQLYKVTPAGIVDPAWNGGNPVNLVGIDLTTTYDMQLTYAYEALNNDKIYITCTFSSPVGPASGVVRINAVDGTLDTTYGDGGFVVFDPLNLPGNGATCDDISIYGITVAPDGAAYIFGTLSSDADTGSNTCNENVAVIIKFTALGVVDTTFGTNGIFWHSNGIVGQWTDSTLSLLINNCDNSLIYATIVYYPNYITSIIKVTSAGILDPDFTIIDNTEYYGAYLLKRNDGYVLFVANDFDTYSTTTLLSFNCETFA